MVDFSGTCLRDLSKHVRWIILQRFHGYISIYVWNNILIMLVLPLNKAWQQSQVNRSRRPSCRPSLICKRCLGFGDDVMACCTAPKIRNSLDWNSSLSINHETWAGKIWIYWSVTNGSNGKVTRGLGISGFFSLWGDPMTIAGWLLYPFDGNTLWFNSGLMGFNGGFSWWLNVVVFLGGFHGV